VSTRFTTATGSSAGRRWRSCASTCAPCCSVAVPIGTSAARSSEQPGRRARRRVSFRTEKRKRRCWPNRTDPLGGPSGIWMRITQSLLDFPACGNCHPSAAARTENAPAATQAVGYGLTDSPAGLAAWLLVHPGFAQWTYGSDPQQSPAKDEVLDDFTLYWLTNSATSSARLYWENGGRGVISAAAQKTAEISLPVAITIFPEDVYRPPETWARRAYRNLIYFHEVDKGGHFAAWEQPELFAAELRAAFRSLRLARVSAQ